MNPSRSDFLAGIEMVGNNFQYTGDERRKKALDKISPMCSVFPNLITLKEIKRRNKKKCSKFKQTRNRSHIEFRFFIKNLHSYN